jgi:hypothetical protein
MTFTLTSQLTSKTCCLLKSDPIPQCGRLVCTRQFNIKKLPFANLFQIVAELTPHPRPEKHVLAPPIDTVCDKNTKVSPVDRPRQALLYAPSHDLVRSTVKVHGLKVAILNFRFRPEVPAAFSILAPQWHIKFIFTRLRSIARENSFGIFVKVSGRLPTPKTRSAPPGDGCSRERNLNPPPS